MRRESAAGVEPVAGEVVVNEAVAEPSASRLAGVVTSLDRIFPILWIGIYLLLPVSGWASEMFESWFDQQRDLETLRSLLATGRADAIVDSGIGPAYIGVAALLHEVFRLSPEDSLIVLTRASYVLSVAAGLLLVRLAVTRLAQVWPIVSLASQLVFVALVFSAGTWYWSDVPWSHFFAAFLGVMVFVVRFAPARPTVFYAALAGVLLSLLATTRTFELLALVLAWGIAAVGLAALRVSSSRPWNFRRAAAGVAAFVTTTVVVYAATGKRGLFFLYGSNLDSQSGSVSGAEVAQTPTLSLGLVPVKLVQLFVDPCYLSLCTISDYEAGGGSGTNIDLWSLPLAIQLPALFVLPLCIIGTAWLVVRAVRQRDAIRGRGELRLLVEMTIAASGLTLGYVASTLTGPSHLRYGFARDFLLASLLTAVVIVTLVSIAGWHLLARRRGGLLSPEARFVLAAVVSAVVVVGGVTYARSAGLPRFEGRHLETVVYTARCAGGECDVRVVATTPSGRPIVIPEASTLTFGCGTDEARFTLYVAKLTAGVRIPSDCENPRLVAGWPTVMGLPPGSFELAAVEVRNA